MNPKDLAAWAAKFTKKGTKAAVDFDDDDEPAAAPARAQAWGPPARAVARRGDVWAPPETDVLVKPAPSAYADILASVPDLAPDLTGGADAMEGRMSRESAAAINDALIGQEVVHGVRPEDPKDVVPRGHRGVGGSYNITPLVDLQKPN